MRSRGLWWLEGKPPKSTKWQKHIQKKKKPNKKRNLNAEAAEVKCPFLILDKGFIQYMIRQKGVCGHMEGAENKT